MSKQTGLTEATELLQRLAELDPMRFERTRNTLKLAVDVALTEKRIDQQRNRGHPPQQGYFWKQPCGICGAIRAECRCCRWE